MLWEDQLWNIWLKIKGDIHSKLQLIFAVNINTTQRVKQQKENTVSIKCFSNFVQLQRENTHLDGCKISETQANLSV